jgi:hypothetical protein
MLPKQQSTSFWSQGILGVKKVITLGEKLCYSKMLYPPYTSLKHGIALQQASINKA